jgi:hypothetical protein
MPEVNHESRLDEILFENKAQVVCERLESCNKPIVKLMVTDED